MSISCFYKLHMIIGFLVVDRFELQLSQVYYLTWSDICCCLLAVQVQRLCSIWGDFGTDISLTEGCLSTTTPPPQHCSNLSVCLCRETLPDSAAAFLPITKFCQTKKVLESQPNVSLLQDRLSAVGGGGQDGKISLKGIKICLSY